MAKSVIQVILEASLFSDSLKESYNPNDVVIMLDILRKKSNADYLLINLVGESHNSLYPIKQEFERIASSNNIIITDKSYGKQNKLNALNRNEVPVTCLCEAGINYDVKSLIYIASDINLSNDKYESLKRDLLNTKIAQNRFNKIGSIGTYLSNFEAYAINTNEENISKSVTVDNLYVSTKTNTEGIIECIKKSLAKIDPFWMIENDDEYSDLDANIEQNIENTPFI